MAKENHLPPYIKYMTHIFEQTTTLDSIELKIQRLIFYPNKSEWKVSKMYLAVALWAHRGLSSYMVYPGRVRGGLIQY